jgi:hypothetical protein
MDLKVLLDAVVSSWLKVYPLVVNLLAPLFLLLIGFMAAKGIAALTTVVLKIIQLDRGAKAVKFNLLLEKGDIRKSAAELAGDLVYWVIVFVTVLGVAKAFGLPVDQALASIFSYVGLVFVAALVMGIGAFLASLIAGMVRIIAANFGIEGAKTISRFIYYIVIIFAFLAALAQLGISTEVFIPQIGVIIGAIGLAAAIAFGLGCKDMAADFLHNLFRGR